jgi:hypothetical protein
VRLEGLGQFKKKNSSSGPESATFRLVPQCLYQLHKRVPLYRIPISPTLKFECIFLQMYLFSRNTFISTAACRTNSDVGLQNVQEQLPTQFHVINLINWTLSTKESLKELETQPFCASSYRSSRYKRGRNSNMTDRKEGNILYSIAKKQQCKLPQIEADAITIVKVNLKPSLYQAVKTHRVVRR